MEDDSIRRVDLLERMRAQAGLIADLQRDLARALRTIRLQRFVLAAGVAFYAVSIGAWWMATRGHAADAATVHRPGPEMILERGEGPDMVWCTPWEPTGQLCSGGHGCVWERWCTEPDCPGMPCDLSDHQTQCRSHHGAGCNSLLSQIE